MIITYFRSSSYSNFEFCEMSYFCNYVLGLDDPSGFAATKGSLTHKILELLAHTVKVPHNVNGLIDKVYKTFSSESPRFNWSDNDYRDCKTWVYRALEFNNGQFDPRKSDIVAAEMPFDFEIQRPWAHYKYGEKEGFLALKGTIDLVTRLTPKVFEVVDYKSGRRMNWNTGEVYTHESLRDNIQLRLYHYAVHHTYPELDQVLVTMFYLKDGGPYTICYNKEDLKVTENLLRRKFEQIQNTKVPHLTKSWKCSKLCTWGKTSFADCKFVEPIIDFNNEDGSPLTKCKQLKFEIERQGVNNVIKKYTKPGHEIDFYKEPS